MDRDTYQLLDYAQYRLYIKEANKNLKDEWRVAYRFLSYYGVPDMSPNSYASIISRMEVCSLALIDP